MQYKIEKCFAVLIIHSHELWNIETLMLNHIVDNIEQYGQQNWIL